MAPIHGHTCLLRERLNSFGELQLSLTLQERCYCQRVVAPTFIGTHNCSTNELNLTQLWFTNHSHSEFTNPLTQKENWTPERLDELLERRKFCGKRRNKGPNLVNSSNSKYTILKISAWKFKDLTFLCLILFNVNDHFAI